MRAAGWRPVPQEAQALIRRQRQRQPVPLDLVAALLAQVLELLGVSTPSATTLRPSECAIVMTVVVIASSSGSVVMSPTNSLSIFSVSIGRRLR